MTAGQAGLRGEFEDKSTYPKSLKNTFLWSRIVCLILQMTRQQQQQQCRTLRLCSLLSFLQSWPVLSSRQSANSGCPPVLPRDKRTFFSLSLA